MGKPLAESSAEIGKCAWACEWYAEHAPTLLSPEAAHTGALRSRMIYTPMGVLLAIMPWNFPYWQVIRALAPALSAGDVVVLKHAPRPPDARSRSPARPARPGCPREPCPSWW
jgi:succinate-semialdehyde dehydrogenase / glutarate-semialdehyde dehydrogenase